MRKRILVVQPRLAAFGGGTGVCAWVLEALKDAHDVSLLAWHPPDWAAVNRFYGTTLGPADVRVEALASILPPAWWPPRRLRRLAQYVLLARARRRRGEFDLLISAEEESDLGGAGIQYVHMPRHAPPASAAQALYHRVAARLTGTDPARMWSNVTVVNSEWTAAQLRAMHGVEAITIYPPAAGSFPDVPWEQREDGLVCVGRFSPEKRFELVIDIVDGLRARGRAVRLELVGSSDDPAYEQRIAELVRARPWVTIHKGLSRDALARLMAARRWGIHGMAEEHYGMAVAEMVLAGMVPFVPAGGGQVEIVRDARLTFRDRAEAVAKILAIAGDHAAQTALRAQLQTRRGELGPERFMAEVRALVARTP